MTTKDEALRMAREALEFSKSYLNDLSDAYGTSKKAKPGSTAWHVDRAIAACREALAQKDEQERDLPEPAYAACRIGTDMDGEEVRVDLYSEQQMRDFARPPKRNPLTDDELNVCAGGFQVMPGTWCYAFARAIEAHHGIGGQGG